MSPQPSLAIIGAGNLGGAIAKGLVQAELYKPNDIILTRRKVHLLDSFSELGYHVTTDNQAAIQAVSVIIIAVEPKQLSAALSEIRSAVKPKQHILISVVSGVSLDFIEKSLGKKLPLVRAMPNTAIKHGESMTCLCSKSSSPKPLELAQTIFNAVGRTCIISEELMTSATALCASGVAFFLRAIRAATQAGIEIGFHPEEAVQLAAQTAKGAACLLTDGQSHPESEIDKVTTPRGCTITGLNEMEHHGFSAAMIKGIKTSVEKAEKFSPKKND